MLNAANLCNFNHHVFHTGILEVLVSGFIVIICNYALSNSYVMNAMIK